MSQGNLCGAKIKISTHINTTNTITVSCDKYEGHEGDHSKMFYHCVEIKKEGEWPYHDNYRLGEITWKPELPIISQP